MQLWQKNPLGLDRRYWSFKLIDRRTDRQTDDLRCHKPHTEVRKYAAVTRVLERYRHCTFLEISHELDAARIPIRSRMHSPFRVANV